MTPTLYLHWTARPTTGSALGTITRSSAVMAVCTDCMITTWICRLTPTAATATASRCPVPAWAVCPIHGHPNGVPTQQPLRRSSFQPRWSLDARQLRTGDLGRDRGALGSAAAVQERFHRLRGPAAASHSQALLREPDGRLEQELLAFRGTTTIQARGRELSVQLDSSGRSWALASDLLERYDCLLYTSPSPRDLSTSRMPSSA